MFTILADSNALTAAAESGRLELLPIRCDRIVLTPTVVDELVESGVIDELVASAVERIVEVVSLTQDDEARARQLQEQIAIRSPEGEVGKQRGAAEVMALMERDDLAGDLLLCEAGAVLAVAREQGIPAERFAVWTVEGEEERGEREEESGEREVVYGMWSEENKTDTDTRAVRSKIQNRVPWGESKIVELDRETASSIDTLVERGLGRDAADVVRRAVRGLMAALED